jgi:hypothetical protein
VPRPGLSRLDVDSLTDHQRRVRSAQVLEAEAGPTQMR